LKEEFSWDSLDLGLSLELMPCSSPATILKVEEKAYMLEFGQPGVKGAYYFACWKGLYI